MCDIDVASSVANGADTPTKASENGKHRNDSAATTIISLCKRRYDVAIVCVVIVAVWALLALPTIFYHLPMKVTIQLLLALCNHELQVNIKLCILLCYMHCFY